MLIVKIIICILALFFWGLVNTEYQKPMHERKTKECTIFASIAGILSISFCVLLIITRWNIWTIPKILLFISVGLQFLFQDEDEFSIQFWYGIIITVIAYGVSGIIYVENIKESETPNVSVTTCNLISAKDNSSINGDIFGGIFYINASLSEKSIYKYYYRLNDGGIKQGTIPADSTTIYFINDDEQPYLETITTTTYWINNNKKPPESYRIKSQKIIYNLYVPNGSITNVYEFDAE